MLHQGYDQLRIFANNLNISRTLNSDRLVLIAAFVKAYHDFIIEVIANGELAFTAISLSLYLALYKFIKFELLHFSVFRNQFANLVIFEELSIIVFDNSIKVILLPLNLFFIRKSMQRFNNILNLCVANLFYFFLCCFDFLFLSVLCALFNSHKFVFMVIHILLRCFCFVALILSEPIVEVLHVNGSAELYHKKGSVLLLEHMSYFSMLAKIFAKELVATFGVEEAFYSPNAYSVCGVLLFDFFLKFLKVGSFSFWCFLHYNKQIIIIAFLVKCI